MLDRVFFSREHVTVLERWIDEMDEELPALRNFILPVRGVQPRGERPGSSALSFPFRRGRHRGAASLPPTFSSRAPCADARRGARWRWCGRVRCPPPLAAT